MVNIDQSMVDTNKVGTYKVKYEVTLDGFSEHIYRIVHVVGEDDSVIRLLGEETVYLNVFELYEDAGYEVLDDNLKYDVIVTTNLDVTRVGEYMINYVFSYENGGKNVFFRKIIVY